MKRAWMALASVALLAAGCQTAPQVTPEQVAAITNAVAQAQALYHEIQPVVEQLQPLVQQALKDSETVGLGSERGRDPRWHAVRDAYAKAHPYCAVCGRRTEQVHHKLSVHLPPELELEPDNLVALCLRDHFLFGHLCDWRLENPEIDGDIAAWRAKLRTEEPR